MLADPEILKELVRTKLESKEGIIKLCEMASTYLQDVVNTCPNHARVLVNRNFLLIFIEILEGAKKEIVGKDLADIKDLLKEAVDDKQEPGTTP